MKAGAAFRLLAVLAVVVAGGLSGGCGFRPMYLSGGDAKVERTVGAALADISIAPIPDRIGQLVRNDLLFLTSRAGADDPNAAYRLDVQLRESVSEMAVESTGFATRANLRLNAVYTLVDQAGGKPLVSGRARAISSYNIVDSTFSTLTAQNTARERAAARIAQDIRSRLGAYFAGREKAADTGAAAGAAEPVAMPEPVPEPVRAPASLGRVPSGL